MACQDGELPFGFQWLPVGRFLGSLTGTPVVGSQVLAYLRPGGVIVRTVYTCQLTDHWPVMAQSDPDTSALRGRVHYFSSDV